MKKHIGVVIAIIVLATMLLTGCDSGPLEYSEVVGDYGAFECDDNDCVWFESSGGKYISAEWKISDSENCIVTISYVITDENVECYDEDFWTEYHEAGFDNPYDALEEYLYDIAESYELPPEGEYKYDRSEEKLVSMDTDTEYYKKD